MKKLILTALALALGLSPAYAQKTKAQISSEITTLFPDNAAGLITPLGLRTVTNDLAISIMPTAPVVSGNLACFDGTTGLLQDCGAAPGTAPLIIGTTPISGGTTTRVLFDNGGALGEYQISGTGDVCMTTSCQMTTPNLGVPSAVVLTNGTGLPTTALTGTLQAAQEPAHTGDCTNSAGSLALTCLSTNSVAFTSTATAASGQLPATATNDNAAAGKVGEYVQSAIAVSTVSLSTGTAKDVTSISLTAGDWDVNVSAYFTLTASTNVTVLQASISGTTNTIDTTVGKWSQITFPGTVPGAGQTTLSIPSYRLSLSGTTTVYFVVQGNFTVSTMTAGGLIRARRAR